MRVAVIGSGISGLSAAWLLSRKHEVHLFEKESRLGGHTHTHTIETSLGPKQIDTGFIVHNDKTYPNLIRLFDELGIVRDDSEMSWGVTGDQGRIEYSSLGLGGFFAAKMRMFAPGQWKLLLDILRFNREAEAVLRSGRAESLTLGAFVEERAYSPIFRDYYLHPTVASIWSTGRVRRSSRRSGTSWTGFAGYCALGRRTMCSKSAPVGARLRSMLPVALDAA